MWYDQSEYQVRMEWGRMGVQKLAPISDVTIIVDVLSFSTAVDIVVNRAASVYPWRWKDDSAIEFAKKKQLLLAQFDRTATGFSLSPKSLRNLPYNAGIVLPSPNGSTLSLLAESKNVIAGCIRNARSVAKYALENGQTIALIPAGEKWSDESLRPAFEDLVGAGSILANFGDLHMSPECLSALALFEKCRGELFENIRNSLSGRELESRGFLEDVEIASELNVSTSVPILKNGSFVDQTNL